MTFHASEIGVKPVRIETSLEALAPTCGERLAHDERPAVVGEDYGGALMVFGNDSPRPLEGRMSLTVYDTRLRQASDVV